MKQWQSGNNFETCHSSLVLYKGIQKICHRSGYVLIGYMQSCGFFCIMLHSSCYGYIYIVLYTYTLHLDQ